MRLPVSAPNAAKPHRSLQPRHPRGQSRCSSPDKSASTHATGALVDGGVTAQTEQVMRNIGTLLRGRGRRASRTSSARRSFLADMDEFAAMNAGLRPPRRRPAAGAIDRAGRARCQTRASRST